MITAEILDNSVYSCNACNQRNARVDVGFGPTSTSRLVVRLCATCVDILYQRLADV